MRKANGTAGFTLIELLVAFAVLGVLVALAMPGFQSFIANQRVKAASDQLLMSFMYARSEAVKRRETVDVSPLGSSWSSGWEVSVGSVSLRSESLAGISVSAAETTAVSFNAQGRAAIGSGDAITFSICDEAGKAIGREVRLSFSGQARVIMGEACADAGS